MSHHDPNGARVMKHPLASRLFHWGLILGFLPAAVTGFIIWYKPDNGDFANLAMRIHIIGAAILTVSAILYSIFKLDRIVSFLRRIFTWDQRDMRWMMLQGGYPQKILFGINILVPPMGKMNSGQKIFGICLFFGSIIIMLTGWVLYAFIPVAPKEVIYWFDQAHLVLGIFLGVFMFVHICLGIYNWGEFLAMFGDGTQPLEEAKHHNPVWVNEEVEPVKGSRQAG